MSIALSIVYNGCLYAATDDGISGDGVQQHVPHAKIQHNDYFALTLSGQTNTYDKNTSLYNLSQYMAEVFFKKIEASTESTLFERCVEVYNSILLNDPTATFDPRPTEEQNINGTTSRVENNIHIRVIGKKDYYSGNPIIIHIDYYVDKNSQVNPNPVTDNCTPIGGTCILLSRAGDGWSTLGKSDQDIINEIGSYIKDNKCSDKDAIEEILKKHATNNKAVAFNNSPIIVCVKLP